MSKNSGYLVETKLGKRGKTYHSKSLINGKIIVYVENEQKPILCDPKTLKIIGFVN